jgi:hypothetical protein
MDKDDIIFSIKQLLAQYISGEAPAIAVTIVTQKGMHGVFGARTVPDRLALIGALKVTAQDVAESLTPEEPSAVATEHMS